MDAGARQDEKIDMNAFISGITAEGMVALGLMKNPVTGMTSRDDRHARMVIGTLELLEAKTQGNLTADEGNNIRQALHHLRMLYVSGAARRQDGSDHAAGEGK